MNTRKQELIQKSKINPGTKTFRATDPEVEHVRKLLVTKNGKHYPPYDHQIAAVINAYNELRQDIPRTS